jgi:DNA-binding CsgD family transcriptional regulator
MAAPHSPSPAESCPQPGDRPRWHFPYWLAAVPLLLVTGFVLLPFAVGTSYAALAVGPATAASWTDAAAPVAATAGATGLSLWLLVRAHRRRQAYEADLVAWAETRALQQERARVAATAPTPPALAGLTRRESEVLALIAQGRSNTEIAADLFISVKTVKTHVGHLLAKTGARDRAQLVSLALSP